MECGPHCLQILCPNKILVFFVCFLFSEQMITTRHRTQNQTSIKMLLQFRRKNRNKPPPPNNCFTVRTMNLYLPNTFQSHEESNFAFMLKDVRSVHYQKTSDPKQCQIPSQN